MRFRNFVPGIVFCGLVLFDVIGILCCYYLVSSNNCLFAFVIRVTYKFLSYAVFDLGHEYYTL